MGPPQPHAWHPCRRSIVVASALLACALAAIPAVMAAGQENDKQVTICHATSSERNPYVQNHPAIRNNGDLLGGHLGHADDIIPPYLQYSDPDGTEHWFGGQNWTGPGQAIWEKDCDVEPEPPTPSTRIAVVKSLSPRDDPGRFDLKVGSTTVAENIGNNGTGAASVEPGTPYTVSEAGVGGTNLGDFDIASRCTATDGSDVGTSHGESVSGVTVAEGKTVTCVFTNTRKPPPDSESITPELECVLFKDGQPDVAYWSYNNTNGHDVVIPQGDQNTFVPSSANGPAKPPTRFLAGHQVGAFTTDVPAGGSLVWSLTGISSDPASADSESCNATTIEVRKVTVPANDPGKFILLINNAEVASGGHGTTSGHLAIGAGEATVRETAGPGTNLGDYTSKVECTNGTATRSAEGAKIDGKIAKGDTVVCTFTNTRKGAPPQPPEPLPPTPPNPDPEPVPPTPPGPAPRLDLVVTKSVVPETVVVGGRLTWTMIVTNRSSVAAADVNGVKVDDPRSFRTRLISLRASQGTCRPYTCDLGRLAPGASARVIAVSEATRVGVVANIVRVSSEEQESNYRNNVAAASAQVVGRLTPPFVQNRCDTLTVAPRILQNRRSSVVLLTARDGRGRPLAGVRVRVRGPGVDTIVTTDRRGTVRRTVLPRRTGLFFFTGLPRAQTGGGMHCRTLLGVLGASDTRVTG